MAFARARRPWAGARSWRVGVPGVASASPPEGRGASPAAIVPALERLRRRSDFLRVAAGRRKWVAPGLILQTLASNPETQGPQPRGPEAIRVGFTATRKIGNAVIRNRARRRLKAAAAAVMPLHARPGFDYVLIARAETPKRVYGALLADLETALRRLGTWREESAEEGDRNPC